MAGSLRNRQTNRMKNLLLLFICCHAIWSCSYQTTDNSNSADKSATNDSLIAQTVTSEIQINGSLPFGCADLTNYKYPKRWDADMENYGQLKQPQGKEFEDIGQCFGAINKAAPHPVKPDIHAATHLKIGKDFLNTFYYDTIAQQKIDSLKYRLPDIGNYQCYYFYEQSESIYGYYGILLLLDAKSKAGKTLNVYYEVSGDQHVEFRYFYFDGVTIRIYEGSCYDDGCGLTENYRVNITADGQITVVELKDK